MGDDSKDSAEGILPYQWIMRVVGAEADAAGATAVSVVELPDSFFMRFRLAGNPPEYRVVHPLLTDLVEHRRDMTRMRARFPGLRSRGSGKYQDIFRALGYELEELRAHSVLVDELDDGLLVTYQIIDPRYGFAPHKEMFFMDANACTEMLQRARARRGGRR